MNYYWNKDGTVRATGEKAGQVMEGDEVGDRALRLMDERLSVFVETIPTTLGILLMRINKTGQSQPGTFKTTRTYDRELESRLMKETYQ